VDEDLSVDPDGVQYDTFYGGATEHRDWRD
jgi:hypothetical protein